MLSPWGISLKFKLFLWLEVCRSLRSINELLADFWLYIWLANSYFFMLSLTCFFNVCTTLLKSTWEMTDHVFYHPYSDLYLVAFGHGTLLTFDWVYGTITKSDRENKVERFWKNISPNSSQLYYSFHYPFFPQENNPHLSKFEGINFMLFFFFFSFTLVLLLMIMYYWFKK